MNLSTALAAVLCASGPVGTLHAAVAQKVRRRCLACGFDLLCDVRVFISRVSSADMRLLFGQPTANGSSERRRDI